MAVDEALLTTQVQGLAPPTLRVYRWSPRALSLGYFQNLENEIEAPRCSCLGFDVVRRLTGGRAVLHCDELTYSVTTSERDGLPQSLADSYWFINSGVIAAYRLLGLEVCLVRSDAGSTSAACFAGAGLADLTCRGRKIAGSAQCRKGAGLLQHGSLPVSFDAGLFLSLLKYSSPGIREKALTALTRKAAGISEILGSRIEWEVFKDALREGFQKALGIVLHNAALTPAEIALSRKLVREKYSTDAWNEHGEYESERALNVRTKNAPLVP